MGTAFDDLICVGVVIGTHGLRGDLKVRPVTDGANSLLDARTVQMRHPQTGASGDYRPVRVVTHKKWLLLRLKGYEDINRVQSLIGCEVLMPAEDLPDLAADEFYWRQLEGLAVIDRSRGPIGTLEDMFTTAAHDIYVVQGEFGEVLVPAVEQFVVEIDLEKQTMLVDLPEGLVPEPDEV